MLFKKTPDIPFARLPDTLPVWPSSEQLLLPGGQLKLTMKQENDILLTQDALGTQDRLVGVVLKPSNADVASDISESSKGASPLSEITLLRAPQAHLYQVGTAGRVTAFEETSEGYFIITLTGYCRFDVREEVPTMRRYQRFAIKWSAYHEDMRINPEPDDIDRQELIAALVDYCSRKSIPMDWSLMERMPLFNIITFFAMRIEIGVENKQRLLQAVTLQERAHSLMSLLIAA